MSYPQQPVLPNSFHGSTTFNSQIKSYNHLAQRVRRSLGEPLIQLEISSEQMYELIDISLEYFTKFAGVEEEYLVFRSDLYKKGVGLHIGELMNITPDMYKDNTSNPSLSASFDYDLDDYRRVVDVFSFGNSTNNAIYRILLEESGDNTATFEGTIEFTMLNQINVDLDATYTNLATIDSDIDIIVHEDLTDEDSPRINYNDLGADNYLIQKIVEVRDCSLIIDPENADGTVFNCVPK